MTKYVFTYHGTGDMPATEEGVAAVMEAWGAWFGSLGDALTDGGNPFGPCRTVAPDGSVTDGNVASLSGYSIVEARDLDAAVNVAHGCPVLAADGSGSVCETSDP
jgi:hypothetical protein